MHLNVPTNWDDQLLSGLEGLPIHSFYGRLPLDVVGGGRPAAALPEVSRQQAARHIKLIHRLGYEFNYVLNASCLGNMEYAPRNHSAIGELLDWIAELEVEAVTVSVPYLMEIIRRHYPQLRIVASVFCHIDSVDQARLYQQLGVDEITIVQLFNRNFRFLRSFREQLDVKLQLIVNNACLLGCPYRRYHANINSHASSSLGCQPAFDYPTVCCTRTRLAHPEELIKSPWIRPEDLHYYEEIGLDRFKLSGRTKNTPWLKTAISAYAKRKSPANLARLLSIPNGPGSIKRRTYNGVPEVELVIDNRQLDGFMQHFIDKECQLASCQACGYCQRMARIAVKTDAQRAGEAVSAYNRLLEEQLAATDSNLNP
jgi:collagenase-like PrtC family protease